MPRKKQSGFTPIIAVIIATVLLAGAGGGYYYLQSSRPPFKQSLPDKSKQPVPPQSTPLPPNQTQSTKQSNSSKTSPIPTPSSATLSKDETANLFYTAPYIFSIYSSLYCHYEKSSSQYPIQLSDILPECLNKVNASILDPTTHQPYNYQQTQDGREYIIKTKLPDGNEFTITEITFYSQEEQEELKKRSRDAARLTDLANLQQAINVTLYDNPTLPVTNILCSDQTASSCYGNSLRSSLSSDGTGWLKVNLNNQKSVALPKLPKDPLNNLFYHYSYCAKGDLWEINTVLESEQQKVKMQADGGDDDNRYEIGSSFNLIGPKGECQY